MLGPRIPAETLECLWTMLAHSHGTLLNASRLAAGLSVAAAPSRTSASFYRTSAGAEIDLVLDLPKAGRWAIAIKRGLTPRVEKAPLNAARPSRPTRPRH